MEKDCDGRLTLQDILKHPFILNNQNLKISEQKSDNTQFSDEILQRMKEFHGSSLLKKAAMRIFVDHIDPKKINDLKLEF